MNSRANVYLIDDPTRIAKKIWENSPNEAKESIKWADETINGNILHRAHYEMEKTNIPVQFSDELWSKVPKNANLNDEEWIYAFSRHSILLNLAKAIFYNSEKRKDYLSSFSLIFNSFIKNTKPTTEFLNTSWRSLESGIRPENWIRSLELIEKVDDTTKLREVMENSLSSHISQLLKTHKSFHRLSNWGIIQDHGLFLSSLFLNKKDEMNIAIERLDEELHFQTLEGGIHWEQSPLYQAEVLHSILDTVMLSERFGIILPETLIKNAKSLSLGLSSLTSPDSRIYPLGDSDPIKVNDLLYQASRLFNIEIPNAYPSEESFWDFPDCYPLKKAKKKSIIMPNGGHAILRGDEIEAHFFFGNMGSGHGHLSQLHVDIATNEGQIITDSGRYTYTDTEYRKKFKDSESHNVILLEGPSPFSSKGAWGYTGIPEALPGRHFFSKEVDYVEAVSLAYLTKGIALKRKLIRLGKSIIVIIDEVFSDDNQNFYSLFHLKPKTTILLDDHYFNLNLKDLNILLHGWSSGNIFVENSNYSKEYNDIEKNTVLKFKKFGNSIVTIFSTKKLKITPLETTTLDSKIVLNEKEATALRIESSDVKWTILTRQKEIVHHVDVLKAGDIEGYGRTIVLNSKWKYPLNIGM